MLVNPICGIYSCYSQYRLFPLYGVNLRVGVAAAMYMVLNAHRCSQLYDGFGAKPTAKPKAKRPRWGGTETFRAILASLTLSRGIHFRDYRQVSGVQCLTHISLNPFDMLNFSKTGYFKIGIKCSVRGCKHRESESHSPPSFAIYSKS
jgi:hypothetical protein